MDVNQILYEDQDCIVCRKPAGVPTQSAKLAEQDMVSLLKNYRAGKKESTYIGVCHRLDQPVEGIMVFAKNKESASCLSEQVAKRQVGKYYYALILGQINPPMGELIDYMKKDDSMHGSVICSASDPEAKLARLSYHTIATRLLLPDIEASLVSIKLETGRLHQIRLQFANQKNPLIGDRKYGVGPSDRIGRTVALCSYQLEFVHPKTHERMKFSIRPQNPIFDLFLQDMQ